MIEFEFIEVPEINLDYIQEWFIKVVENEGKTLSNITVVLGSDDWLLEQNKSFLKHDYYTDIITFDYCEMDFISGDLLISIEDRKSTRLNSSHVRISYAVFCLKKKNNRYIIE